MCPNDTSKNRSSVGKLKAEAVLEHEPIEILYHENGKVACEKWEPGKGPDGLECRKSYEDGNIIDEY